MLNFVNLSSLYFRHRTCSWLERQAAICGLLAWNFTAIYWNGFITASSEPGGAIRIAGIVLIWALLGYGLFFIFAYQVRHFQARPVSRCPG